MSFANMRAPRAYPMVRPETAPLLDTGAKGPYVSLLHRLLRVLLKDRWEGIPEYDKLVGDKYTGNTHSLVKSFQSGEYLLNDGVCGYKTWMALTGIEACRMVYEPPAGCYHTQSQKTRCWAAATATLKALPNEIQPAVSRTYYIDTVGGLLNDDPAQAWKDNSKNFAKDMNLVVADQGMSLWWLLFIMNLCGRVMLNSTNLHDNNSHYYVLFTARGDKTAKGTTMGIWDPYPGNNKKGAVMYRSYNWLKQQYRDVTYRVYYSLTGEGKA